MPLDVVETLCDLIRLPSVNPMGRDVSGEEFYEYRVTDYLERTFERLGLSWQRQPIAPKRDNILARFDGDVPPDEGGKILMFEVHQDTVPVDGMTISPWTPEVRDGRVYGRGACDIKGGMACILAALARLVEQRPTGLPTIVMACSVNEEYGFTGASQMPKVWGNDDGTLVPRAPDAVVVAEPTELNVVVAHKGVARWRCHTHGRAVHSSQPELGDNAIYRMAHVLSAWEEYARDVVPNLGHHPLVGTPTLSVGIIAGGVSVNTVPDRCTIEIDRRVLPDEDPITALEHAKAYLANKLGDPQAVEHDEPQLTIRGLKDDQNASLAAGLSETSRRHGGPGECVGVPYGTDAPAFFPDGIPTVVFGPGSIDQAHTADEWVAVDQLHAATEIFYQFACEYGG
ncbi:MAG: M20 family metallopeptidase [Planctomycetes bacterium]|nr:M20 family metallopeptidase [Planctomycetota bacterium]MBL7044454.1 M20 family metallopeptidase [Pirellulaceae bacterium]